MIDFKKLQKALTISALTVITCFTCLILLFGCPGNPDPPPQPEPKISWVETETETGRVVTVLKDTVPILRIYAADGVDGKDGIGINGKDGIDGQDCVFPDTLWLKEIDRKDDQIQYAISTALLPPTQPTPDTAYVKNVILDGDRWIYILRGDSLRLNWMHGYKYTNGTDVDLEDLFFHVAFEMNGVTVSLKPNPNITQELSLIMYGLPEGDIVPCVAAFIIRDGERVYSRSWAKSTDQEQGWYARRE